jgi:hypothetical protein
MFQVYQPSGRVGLFTYLWWLVGMAVAVAAAFVYQLGLHWVPWIYVNALLCAGFGIVLGGIGAFAVRRGPIRNPAVAVFLGITLAVVGLAAKYAFQYQSMLNAATNAHMQASNIPAEKRAEERRKMAKDLTFVLHLRFRADSGWNIGRGGAGLPIKGVLVYLIWLIEAGIVIYFATKQPYNQSREPYSEQSDQWASESDVVMTLPISDPAMVEKIQSASRVEDLLDIPIPKTDESHQFAVYTVNSIPGNEMEDAYLTVSLVTWVQNSKGEREKTEQRLVRHAILPVAQRKQLHENASLLQEAIEAYRQALEEEAAAEAEPE